MDPERPHRSTSLNNSSTSGSNNTTTTSTTSELFICFTSRLSSSSSMKIPSKPIPSPARSSQISLSSSLRRLGSMKGGQASPMFPATTNGKKRGGGFDNPEPSSPKVTCIGQVRVKTKKQGKKFRACRSKRREVSFRKVDHGNGSSNSLESSGSHQDYNMGHFLSSNSHHHHQQQECKKWVHLPLTICEALRAFGSEFNCFLPCRSSCMANNQRDNNREGKTRGSGNGNGRSSSSCWLVAVQEGEGEGREIELVVGGEDDDDERRGSQRRHVFEDIEINDFVDENIGDDEDEARVSICIPPKNALLLMRCRSDPVKMAALANKFWETPLPKHEHEEAEEKLEDQQEDTVEAEMEHEEVSGVSEMFLTCEANEEQEIPEAETEVESVLLNVESTEVGEEEVEETRQESTLKEQILTEVSLDDVEKSPFEEDEPAIEDLQQQQPEAEEEEEEGGGETTQERSELGNPETREPDLENESKEGESQETLLPDCLLLMMCEPKLSMEVSKETWVCSTDFIRWLPEKRKQPVVKQKDGGDEPKRRISVDSNPRPIFLQPPRSSCSFPAAPPMDTAVASSPNGAGGGGSMTSTKDHKVVGGKGYESFALTRCKSEPRRPSAKLAPDACFWKNRKLEPTSLGVGAAGVGF
ncbi:hypothetical protein HRI_004812000 [Hibiscus trionum]|uniref:Uncharacterized protein n=1 Tax=Hibiscus trionum TaxID=183268 RepID=A0A9W7JEN0_HIBTR|nr:hypothetical protein HRI_004812000 [Hibiscus trionum]